MCYLNCWVVHSYSGPLNEWPMDQREVKLHIRTEIDHAREITNEIYENIDHGIIESYESKVKMAQSLEIDVIIITAVVSTAVKAAMDLLITHIQEKIKQRGGEIKGPSSTP